MTVLLNHSPLTRVMTPPSGMLPFLFLLRVKICDVHQTKTHELQDFYFLKVITSLSVLSSIGKNIIISVTKLILD